MLEQARAALAAGDLFAAYDCVRQSDGEDRAAREYLEVLVLARMGETAEAVRLSEAYDLGSRSDADSLSLRARLAKDLALCEQGEKRAALLAEASDRYAEAYQRTGAYFPCINAATMAWLAGDTGRAHALAAQILADPAIDELTDYFGAATKAEALLILGDCDAAEGALRLALTLPGADKGSRSTTLRQLSLLAENASEGAAALLDVVRPPAVAMYAGHIFAEAPQVEALLVVDIDRALAEQDIGIGYGALAAGADILIAERLLARGAALHVVLPFAERDFIAQSVRPAGDGWVQRFQHCRDRAASLTAATRVGFMGDDAQYAFGSTVAMGLARLRAEHLGARCMQLAIWDGRGAERAGTAHDIHLWRSTGLPQALIGPPPLPPVTRPRAQLCTETRVLRAMLFADFPGFSRISERTLPIFWRDLMGGVAEVLARHRDGICSSNAWGDGIFVVFDSVETAAAAAVDIRRSLADFDYRRLEMSAATGMRIGMHYGPVFEATDPITRAQTFYGSEVTLTARIEPVTPPGSVFVTESFAAMLALKGIDGIDCAYMGRVTLPKRAGILRLYSLDAAPAPLVPG